MKSEKILCPFCREEVTEEIEPMEVKSAIGGTYICYKKICRNVSRHWNKKEVVIPYKGERK